MPKKLLWISPFSLHDTSSGAAIQAKTMLESLAKEGVSVLVLGSFIFDTPRGATSFPYLEKEIQERGTKPVIIEDKEYKISYHYTICAHRSLGQFTHDESWRLFIYFSALLNSFRPDVVMGYGVGTFGIAIQSECKRRKIPFVYSLHNGNHPHFDFNDCSLVLTDSKATAALYAQRDRINVQAGGIFIEPEKYIAEERNPRFVTFINPHPTKGISIFAKLALKVQEELPDVEFLVVESRGTFAECLTQLHLPDSDEKPYKRDMFKNVSVAGHTNNMKEVYKITRTLLAPSLWYESWGRVVTEAVLNDIPCVVSTSGGLSEAMGDGGIAIVAPESCHKDHLRIPTDEEIQPWFNALKRTLEEDFSERCARAKEQHSIPRSTARVLEILEPLFAQKASYNPALFYSGSLRMQVDGSFK